MITTRILRKLCKAASSCFPPYEAKLVQAVLAIAFYGFLRVSEYSKTKAGHVLLLTGCKVSATRVVITVPSSKFGKTPIRLKLTAQQQKTICPVENLRQYLSMRPKNEAKELFTLRDGQPITDGSVRRWLRILSNTLQMEVVNPHDLRIGGATWAASQRLA